MGLHQRYARILDGADGNLTLAAPSDQVRKKLTEAFEGMMSALFEQKGAALDINILASDEAQTFINTHSSVLDSSFQHVEMSEGMRKRLQRSDYIFSGLKTFHELNEAFPSLLDENGKRKPFERFLNDVQKIDTTYNRNYLRAEYNFIHQSAQMASKWEEFAEDGDRYNIQYRTAGDDKVRPEHAALDGVTLPFSDPFWEEYLPPNGWNCRCSAVQVRKSKYPVTPREEAMARGEEALQKDTKGMFRFNAGKEQKSVPDYNPYTIQKCKHCEVAQGKLKLVRVPENQLCQACRLCREIEENKTAKAACAKAVKKEARRQIQGENLSNAGFPHSVLVSRNSIDEWTNQPHSAYFEKNLMIFNIKEIFQNSRYLGYVRDPKNRPTVEWSHLFQTQVAGLPSWIIVHEHTDGSYILHSISDGEKILTGIQK